MRQDETFKRGLEMVLTCAVKTELVGTAIHTVGYIVPPEKCSKPCQRIFPLGVPQLL